MRAGGEGEGGGFDQFGEETMGEICCTGWQLTSPDEIIGFEAE